MNAVTAQRRTPWQKIGLTAIGVAIFAYFWINGPLQEQPPVFKFTEKVKGFGEPVRIGEETVPPKFAMLGELERHDYFHIMATREESRPLFGVIGDARTSPGLDPAVAEQVLERAQQLAANPDNVTLKIALDMYYAEERDDNGQPVQLYFQNTGLNKKIKGYAGPIDIGIAVGMDGTIRLVEHIFSMETTSYLNDIEKAGFYERFQNILLNGQTYDVDIVTGASLTTEGIARSVSDVVSIARESPLEIYLDTEPAGFEIDPVLPKTWIIDAILITALFVIAFSKITRRSVKLATGFSIVGIAYLGFFLNNSFTYVTYTQPFLGIQWTYVLGIYAALVLLGAIWDGNSYCRVICPYGNIQRLLVRFMPWRLKLKISNRVLGALRWAITIALIVGIIMGLRDWGSYELFPDLFGLELLSSQWFWLSLAAILVSAYYPMFWCRALCPTGAVLDGITFLTRSRKSTRPANKSRPVKTPVREEPARA
jgi:NosR/NirI family nitrous oxide reductase transcriptional regulator